MRGNVAMMASDVASGGAQVTCFRHDDSCVKMCIFPLKNCFFLMGRA